MKTFRIVQTFEYFSTVKAGSAEEAMEQAQNESVSGADVVEGLVDISVTDKDYEKEQRIKENAVEMYVALLAVIEANKTRTPVAMDSGYHRAMNLAAAAVRKAEGK